MLLVRQVDLVGLLFRVLGPILRWMSKTWLIVSGLRWVGVIACQMVSCVRVAFLGAADDGGAGDGGGLVRY